MCMATKTADSTGLVWFDAAEAPIELSGFAWFEQDHVFRRMPVKPAYQLPPGVEFLAWHTSGGKVRFKTDSKQIVLRVKLRENGIMDHMPRTGSNGFDLYCGEPGKETYFYTTRSCEQEYDFQIFKQEKAQLQTFTVNFPLYQGVDSLQIGLEQGAKILPPEPLKKYVAIYGTSITQGGCASRPGMVTSNILSRKLGRHFVNLGFSGSGRAEPDMCDYLASVDCSVFVCDYDHNAPNPGDMDQNFYDVDFHGTDWKAKRDYYASFLPYVRNRANLVTLVNDMLGELNSSHLGFNSYGREQQQPQTRTYTIETGIEYEE